ncbi:hypothetical protein T265_03229 [Opisthorchis viverrini]|uniref:Cadherin domain-containing protein n=1 Tax=Opisthorchis viverrini TaxID=6198 RepID=A0A074ZT41_OPIVI|nr:hypothetical protein T265_03229 [Opisthorchis viverrini]KER30276.1 hypothetical protein T265_03229 [Opisthorchis viverrini]
MFHLKIYAEDCGQPPQATPVWTLNVILVPTDLPVWSERHYTFFVPSTLPAGGIVGKVTGYAAFDFDVDPSERLGDDTGMCAYAINNHLSDGKFDIDGHGVIRSRINFDPYRDVQYDLNVTGFDCHSPEQRRSTVSVTIVAQSDCRLSWKDVNYEFNSPVLPSPQPIAPMANLNSCETVSKDCKLAEAVLRVKLLWNERALNGLQLDSLGPDFTCDLDPLSLRVLREFCGVSKPHLHELLPQEQIVSHAINIGDVGYNVSTVVHHFNGSTQWTVTEGQLSQVEHRLDNVPFTLSFWMNHSAVPEAVDSPDELSGKEHIVCSTDGQDKNRHHFAVFLHNCKMTLLLRREPVDTKHHELFQLYPSQWRFKVDELCDSQWHHYSLVFQPPPEELVKGILKESIQWRADEQLFDSPPALCFSSQLKLYVDGDLIADPELVQIVEDLPLRRLHEPLEITRMSVGACWHSTLGRFVQHFSGQLAGLTLSRGIAEPDVVLQCIVNCNPRLHMMHPAAGHVKLTDFPALRQSQLDNLIIEVNQVAELGETLRKTVFFTPRLWHRPTERPEPTGIHINTVIRYNGGCPNVSISDHTVQIVRPKMSKSVIATLISTPLRENLSLHGDAISTKLSPDVSHTLVLNAFVQPQPTEVSPSDLWHGVAIFPSVGLWWKRIGSANVTWELDTDGVVSFCDIEICPSPSAGELESEEKLAVNQLSGLHQEIFPSGLRLTGPAQVDNFVTALRHVHWFHLSPSPGLSSRCFQVYCVAQFQSTDVTGSTNQLRIQSNTLTSRFSIHSPKGPAVPEPATVQQHRTSFHEPRTLRSLSKRELSKPLGSPNTWSYQQQLTYALIGCALAILLVMAVLGTVTAIRFGGFRMRYRLPNGWKASSQHAFHMAVRQSQRGQPPPVIPQSSSLQIMVNPASNPQEVEELERKFCYYDRQVYADDMYDPENATDINEDLSDFETPTDTVSNKPPACIA